MFRVKIAAIAALVVLGALAAWKVPAVLADHPVATTCQQTSVPVRLSTKDSTTYHVVGWLCGKGDTRDKAVQLLLSGATYDHNYWDLPYQPDAYSYVRAATDAGYATFNIDRIGIGLSDHPPAAQVTIPSEGYVTHQLVQALRAGQVGGTKFGAVIGVGHSLGAAMWIYEAATYNDVNGLILADYLHDPNVAQQKAIAATMYPANQDPAFAGKNIPAGYLTTKPGTRSADFYGSGQVIPAVAAQDEALKSTATSGEMGSLNVARDPKLSRAIQVPTMLVVGQLDALGCAAGLSCANAADVLSREQIDYSPTACLSAVVLPGAGHDTNLHPQAHQWYATAGDWAGLRVGTDPAKRPAQPCPGPTELQLAHR
jgi:Alpha/beta hydrolase family